LVAWKDNN